MKQIKYNYLLKEINFLLIFFFYSQYFQGQTLLPTAENAFDIQLPFNKKYISEHKIKSIIFDIIDKKDLQVAEDKGLLNYYEFNKMGQLTRFYYTVISKIIQKEFYQPPTYSKRHKINNAYTYTKNDYIFDTVSSVYFYNEKNNLILKRNNDGIFYESYYYDYDSQLKVNKERRCKETNVSPLKNEFKLGSQLIISQESFSYAATGKNQVKKICFNDENRPYKEMIFNYNDANQILSIDERYVVAWITQKYTFEYNGTHQLIKAIYTSNSNGLQTTVKTFEYDSNNCLLTEKHYKNDVLLKEISYITNVDKKITSYIIRDPKEKNIRIIKLYYNYY